jgi:hypothetical protein
MHIIDKASFTGLILSYLPLLLSIPICKNEKNPPVKSRRMLQMLQPCVDFLIQFQYIWGKYFKNEIESFR